MAAITVVLGWLSAYVPYLNVVLPAPAAILIYRHGMAVGLTAWTVAVVLVGVLMGNIPGAAILALAGFISAGLGQALRQRLPPGQVMVAATLAAIVWLVLTLLGGMWLLGVNLVDAMFRALEESVRVSGEMYRRLGMRGEQIEQAREQMAASVALLRVVAPAVFLASALTTAFANYWAVRAVLTRLGETLPWFSPFSRWRSSKLPALAMLAGLAMGSLAPQTSWLAPISSNLFVVGLLGAMVQGFSLAWFWLERQQAGRLMKALVVLAAFMFWPVLLALVLAGATDGWFNWRQL